MSEMSDRGTVFRNFDGILNRNQLVEIHTPDGIILIELNRRKDRHKRNILAVAINAPKSFKIVPFKNKKYSERLEELSL